MCGTGGCTRRTGVSWGRVVSGAIQYFFFYFYGGGGEGKNMYGDYSHTFGTESLKFDLDRLTLA